MKKGLGAALLAAVVTVGFGFSDPVTAEDIPENGEIVQLRDLIRQQRGALDRQEKALDVQRIRLEALESRVIEASEARVQRAVHVPTPKVPRGRQSDRYRRYAQSTETGATTSITGPEDAKPETRPEVAAIADVGSVLLPKGRLILEPSINYVRSDVNRAEIAGFSVLPGIIIGNINVSENSRNTVITAPTARVRPHQPVGIGSQGSPRMAG